ITIRDTGRGISDDIMKRIFEPYNSSKKGEGAGLGLSIVNTIVRNINGSIECDTKKNVGTEFKIVLPITSSQK
ncbi:MAG: ATP-binding protein, partial [Desulfamplus sp.]